MRSSAPLDGEQDERTWKAVGTASKRRDDAQRDSRRVKSHTAHAQDAEFYAEALYEDPNATLDDLREAVTTLEDTERIARRVFGGAHPLTMGIECDLQRSRAALRARETPPAGDK